jgi:phthiocerol/phenolphthiocerol synthesis type-I polyketide synthase E
MIQENITSEETGLEVAVIGMAGRFPGAANIEQYWENIRNGVEAIKFFTTEELEQAGVEKQLLDNPNYVRANGVLEGIENFDAAFFGLTPREAEVMDPQVRLFLESSYHALEDAALDPDTFKGFIGVYAGASAHFYWELLAQFSDLGGTIDAYSAQQLKEKDFLAVQTSYRLNLKGPAILIHTACSTSLVAVVTACQGLLSGECDVALAGGSTVRIPQNTGYLYTEGMIASPDGHCRAFDHKALGTISGNGVGVVVLKLLDKAREDGDHIYAVVKGSAINNDGNRKAGISAPSVDGQAEVIRAAHRMAEIDPETITYIEAHGTGTPLGDPVEMEALILAFNSEKRSYCGLGSVKSNIGHLDCAAGIAGFIKTVQALKNKQIPPTLHYEKPNPKIDFENSPFYVNAELKEWKRSGSPLRAGVSSFGIGGTNAHVLLEEYIPEEQGHGTGTPANQTPQILVLSAKSETALDTMTENLAGFLSQTGNLEDVAFTLQRGRKRHPYRRAVVCNAIEEAAKILNTPGHTNRQTLKNDEDKRPVIFMFSGQGSQYVNMGKDLYEREPKFREEMDRSFEILNPLMGIDAREILYPTDPAANPEKINRTENTQPLIFAVEHALARLLMEWGIKPYAMVGHSIGEYVAAHISGVFTLEDALKLVVERGKQMQAMPGGAMLSVPMPEQELKDQLIPGVDLAAVNSSGQCVVSGSYDIIDQFEKLLKETGQTVRRLHTSHAYHSVMMEPMLQTFEAEVRNVRLNQPTIPYLSNKTGNWITVQQAQDPVYWAEHIRNTVRFGDAITKLLEEDNALFLEVGPGNALCNFVTKHPAKNTQHKVINHLRHPREQQDDQIYLYGKIAQHWLLGQNIRWEALKGTGNRQPKKLSLPGYPFESKRYWTDNERLEQNQVMGNQITLHGDYRDWLYQPTWKQVRLSVGAHRSCNGSESESYLVLAPADGLAAQWAQRLRQDGYEAVEVKEASEYRQIDAQNFMMDPANPEHYEQLFRQLDTEQRMPHHILHLWNVTGEPGTVNMDEILKRAQQYGYYSLLNLAKALAKYRDNDRNQQEKENTGKSCDEHIYIQVYSDNMQSVIGEELSEPWKTTQLGPVKTIPAEFPGIICRSIDIRLTGTDVSEEKNMFRRSIEEAHDMASDNPDPHTEVAYRNNCRWVRSVEPYRLAKDILPQAAVQNIRLKDGGVYLITGGTGGIGLELADYISKTVNAKLILTARTPLPPKEEWNRENLTEQQQQKIEKIKKMETNGTAVYVCDADVSKREQMESVVNRTEQDVGHIDGVIHAAGVPDGAMIQRRTQNDSETVFAPKLNGTQVLENIFKERKPQRPLDFLVMCSSLASLAAPYGQVAYTAANNYQDAYAASKIDDKTVYRHVVSINWDTWQDVGMAKDAHEKRFPSQQTQPLDGIKSEDGKCVFGRILAENAPQLIVSRYDLQEALKRNMNAQNPGAVADESTVSTANGRKEKGKLHLRPELSTEFVAPATETEKMLAELLIQLLGIDRVGINDNFFELGLSSIDIVNITNQLKDTPGMELSTVDVFENPTLQSLAKHMDDKRVQQQPEDAENRRQAVQKEKEQAQKKERRRAKEMNTGKDRLRQILKKTKEKPDGK